MNNSSPIAYIRKQRKTMATISLLVAGMQVFGYSNFLSGERDSLLYKDNHFYQTRVKDFDKLFPYNLNDELPVDFGIKDINLEKYEEKDTKEVPETINKAISVEIPNIAIQGQDLPAPSQSNREEKNPEENKQGIIGKSETFPIDDPGDNIFMLSLEKLPEDKQEVYLVYELFGLADASGASVTVNDEFARGGYLVKKSNSWTIQKEKINTAELNKGVNFIRFSTLESADYQYMVKNVHLELSDTEQEKQDFSLHQTKLNSYDGHLYISGFANEEMENIVIDGKTIPVRNGKFETILNDVGSGIMISTEKNDVHFSVSNTESAPDKLSEIQEGYHFFEKLFFPAIKNTLSQAGMVLTVEAGSLEKETRFYMSALNYQDLSVTSPEMVNVTGNHSGFRLLPHGEHFVNSPATLEIPYDETKIPAGYKPQDIKTFYFDQGQAKWVALERDTVLLDKKVIVSKTTHFTDFINGIIKVPESPETGSFTPTSIKDIKAADPAAGIVSIPPPTPNNMGAAATSFPIKLPAGRAGIQPSLSVNYNSESGNGWMGIGWDVSIPSISIDTRWGAPRYDTHEETEIYSLAGEMLTMQVGNEFTNPHRTANISRTNNRIFYPRKESGSYLTIKRHGSNPANYWWEVTDKMGNKSFYGGYGNAVVPNAVIKTEEGYIAHWALYRTEDTNGNYVEYTYETTNYTGSGAGAGGKEFYLQRIEYTLNKDTSPEAYYKVDFIRNEYSVGNPSFTARKDININARLGLIQATSDNLTEIRIDYVYKEPQRIRTYRFDYAAPNFSKTQLTKISEYDTNDQLFYSNSLEYFGKEITDGNFMGSSESSDWDGFNDNINASPILSSSGEKFVWKGSPLGFNRGNGYSGGVSVGVGTGANLASKQNTVGVTYDYSFSKNTGYISFIDINGDNLPDKVFKTSSGLKYRLNLGENKEDGSPYGFGIPQSLSGISNFLSSTSNSHNVGVESNFGIYLGYTRNFSKNVTKVYYSDVNGDGLIDVVNNGAVYFNPGLLFPTFNTASITTPNLIPSDTSLNPVIIEEITSQLDEDIENENPLHDIVKRWVAPKSGTISLSGIAKLIPMPVPSLEDDTLEHNDGVCISVEHHRSNPNNPDGNPASGFPKLINFGSGTCGANKYSLTFTLDSNGNVITTSKAMNKSISLSKGDRLYFRVQSKAEGTHDRVEWNPEITYSSITGDTQLDANSLHFFSSSASDGFILTGENNLTVPKNKTYTIDWDDLTVTPNQFSDNLTFSVRVGHLDSEGEFVTDNTYSKVINHTTASTVVFTPSSTAPPIPTTFLSGSMDRVIRFEVSSNSNVDWKDINWKPYVKFQENTNTVRTNAVVNYGIYNHKPSTEIRSDVNLRDITRPLKFTISYNDDLFAFIESLEEEFADGTYPVKLVIKNSNKQVIGTRSMTATVQNVSFLGIYYKKITLSNIGDWIINDTSKFTSKIYVEFFTVNKYLSHYLAASTQIYDKISSTEYELFAKSTAISAKIGNDNFGPNYRYWGQFAYNGNQPNLKIDESKLKLPEIDVDNMPDPDIYDDCGDDPDCYGNNSPDLGIDPQSIPFIVLVPNANKQFEGEEPRFEVWEGNDAETYVQADALSSSRLGINDLESIKIDFDGDPGSVKRMPLVSKGNGNSYAGSFGAGPVGAGGSLSDNVNETLIQYMDMNGDRYPDIVTENRIQYTNPLGKLNELVSTGLGMPSKSNTNGEGVTASGTFINFTTPSVSQDVQRAIAKSRGVQVDAKADVQLPSSSGINASGNWSETEEKSLWIDMNGDGLPDRVTIEEGSVVVRLNLGHKFETTGEVWGNNAELVSKNSNFSGGLGFSIMMNSISGGVSVSAGEAYTEKNFIDINGDGLPDFVENPSGESIRYFLNLGNGFSSSFGTINQAAVNVNRSVGEGANIAFTVGFTILIVKFTVNPRVSISGSADRTENTISDINGDGYPDILFTTTGSNASDGNLKVRLNKIGKTHLLKRVRTPLGGSWVVDYERENNSYEMPNAKWKLTKIELNDGFTGDNAFTPDVARTSVEYTNPHHDRREREFMGYETVKVNQLDVENGDEIYRYSLQEFHTNSYYLKGAVKKESLFGKNENGQMVEWTSTETTYALMARGETNPTNTIEDSDHIFNQGDFGTAIDKSSLFISPIMTTKKFTEGGSGLKETYTEIQQFDANGNIKKYLDKGEGGPDGVTTEIDYLSNATFRGLPIIIEVKADGSTVRQRRAEYDTSNGNLAAVITKLNGSESAFVTFDYGPYGNITKVTHQESIDQNGDPFYYQYTYDDKVHTYPVLVEDAFGYSSHNTYDYRFGALVYTEDMNYMPMRTRIDDRGRVVEITGPYELFVEGLTTSDNAWTIRFEYEGEKPVRDRLLDQGLEFTDYVLDAEGKFEASIGSGGSTKPKTLHHAVTRHFDPEFREDPETPITNNEIYTITLIDGLGKPVQVKKSTSLFHSRTTHAGEPDAAVIDGRDKVVWLVNGKVETDAFGRARKTWYPVWENYNTTTPLNAAALSYNDTGYESGEDFFTEAEYDVLDRVTKTTLPGEDDFMSTEYAIDTNLFKTTVTNEKGQVKQSFTDVRGRTVKVEELSNDAGTIKTEFTYNAIGELLEVEDTDGNITKSTYDMAGRRIELRHPDNGITRFEYDNASNLTAKETSNLLAGGNDEKIEYFYTFNRLDSIVYPKNPHNNVHFFYGQAQDASAADDFSVGRLWYQIDATGVQQFKYGRLGEVRYNLRSVAVPGDKAYWFKTEWEYDTWNRVKKIVYPDEEEVTYFYNRGGELHAITSKKESQQNPDIISQLGYDKFGQREYLRYGNDTETSYSYETNRRRLENMTVRNSSRTFMDNKYQYDILSNVTSVINGASLPTTGQIGGSVEYTYTYDDLNRLRTADALFTGRNAMDDGYEQQQYTLSMAYDKLHNIVSKDQLHQKAPGQSGGTFTDIPATTYRLDYPTGTPQDVGSGYNSAGYTVDTYTYHQPHAPRIIEDKPYATSPDTDKKIKHYDYDPNGNLTAITQTTGESETIEKLRTNLWDEENRLRAVDITPDAEGVRPIAIYTYDAGGERILKHSNTSVSIYLNGKKVADTIQTDATIYPSGMLVARVIPTEEESLSLGYTKHYYAGTQRVSSKIGTTENLGDFLQDWITQGLGGPVDAIGSSMDVLENAEAGVTQVYTELGIDNAPDYNSSPTFIPVPSFVHDGHVEKEVYWFHPDHLGSTSYITNILGEVSQHMEYFAFGETFVEEHRSSNNSPYKFNGKELDEETGWYYYGARYYDPRVSVWLSVDPLASYDPFQNSEHYIDGQHNGGVYNAKNLNVYGYTYQSPVVYLDPNGKQVHNANRPQFHYDSGFANFPKEEPTNQDRINFGKWVAKATVAQAIMPDAANAYLHYMGNTGSHRTFALHKYINEDPSGQELLIFMKSIAMENAEGVLTSPGRITYYSQGFTVGDIGDFSYPQTENWQKAVGAFNVYYKADLTATENNTGGLTYKLNLTIYGEDMYNFNPGNTDLATGTPDAVNGRFEVIDWAKGYLQSGAAKLKEPIVWDSNNSKNKEVVP